MVYLGPNPDSSNDTLSPITWTLHHQVSIIGSFHALAKQQSTYTAEVVKQTTDKVQAGCGLISEFIDDHIILPSFPSY